MSELKAFESERIYWAVEQVERVAGDIDSLHLDDNLFYLKSEADKVIADLEESHKMEVEQLLILNREQANAANRLRDSMERVIRNNKYKRCLAMALLWLERTENSTDLENELVSRKRCSKWMELAEKFKEAK